MTILPSAMSNTELLHATARAARDEQRATADLLALLAELDARRLYLGEGCSSLFTYCTRVLHLSEHSAYHRIEAARAARRFPIILELVADGSVTLTTVALLRPHLTTADHEALLAAARHKSKRDVEHLIAGLAPRPDAKALIRRLPTPSATEIKTTEPLPSAVASQASAGPNLVPASGGENSTTMATLVAAAAVANVGPRTKVAPLSSDRYLLRVTLSADTHARLRRAQELMGHSVPDGNPAVIIDKALSLLVAQLERMKIANVSRPRVASERPARSSSSSRHIPAAVRRQVWARDEGRCAFVGPRGRCAETGRLEFHHVVPFARGGPTTVENVALRCHAHNGYESEQVFGPWPSRAVEPPLESGSR